MSFSEAILKEIQRVQEYLDRLKELAEGNGDRPPAPSGIIIERVAALGPKPQRRKKKRRPLPANALEKPVERHLVNQRMNAEELTKVLRREGVKFTTDPLHSVRNFLWYRWKKGIYHREKVKGRSWVYSMKKSAPDRRARDTKTQKLAPAGSNFSHTGLKDRVLRALLALGGVRVKTRLIAECMEMDYQKVYQSLYWQKGRTVTQDGEYWSLNAAGGKMAEASMDASAAASELRAQKIFPGMSKGDQG